MRRTARAGAGLLSLLLREFWAEAEDRLYSVVPGSYGGGFNPERTRDLFDAPTRISIGHVRHNEGERARRRSDTRRRRRPGRPAVWRRFHVERSRGHKSGGHKWHDQGPVLRDPWPRGSTGDPRPWRPDGHRQMQAIPSHREPRKLVYADTPRKRFNCAPIGQEHVERALRSSLHSCNTKGKGPSDTFIRVQRCAISAPGPAATTSSGRRIFSRSRADPPLLPP